MRYIKHIVQEHFPRLYNTLRWKFGHPAHYKRVADAVVQRYGKKVLNGPFSGMSYIDKAAGSAYIPKLLGCYEMEIHGFIDQVISSDFRTIVDIGCAEGYYAVGLALRCPNAHIFAFDGNAEARELCRQLAELNNVESRITIGGFCDIEQLNNLSLQDALIICDVDGYEADILRPDVVPCLRKATLLVELHEPLRPGVTALLLSGFEASHSLTVVDAVERDETQHPLVNFLSKRDQRLALMESRPPGQQYAYMAAM